MRIIQLKKWGQIRPHFFEQLSRIMAKNTIQMSYDRQFGFIGKYLTGDQAHVRQKWGS